MSDKTQEELEEEFKNKLQEIQLELEEVADHEFGPEIIAALGLEDETRTETDIKRGFRVHWVLPTDVSFNSCDNIEDVESAQRVFAEFASSKTDKNEVQVLPGDVLILTCNHSKIEDEKDENGNPTGQSYFTDACYYVGMCISSEDLKDRNLELHEEALITAFEGNQGDAGRQFIAWDTCGSSEDDCPDDPETIQVDEVVIPDDDGTPGSEKGLVVKSEGYKSKLTEINQLKSLTFSKQSGGTSGSSEPDLYAFEGKGGSAIDEYNNRGLLVKIKELSLNSNPYQVSGYSDTVSLFSTPTTLEQKNYKAVTIESKKVSISSDSCGELTKVSLSGSEYTKSIEVLKKDESGSTQEYTVGTLEANETSGNTVSLGTLDLSSVSLGIRPFTGRHFLPEITEGEVNTIKPDLVLPVITGITFSVSATKPETDSNGCKYRTFSFNLTAQKKNLTFASGVLVNDQDGSEIQEYHTYDFSVCDEVPATSCGSCPGVTASDIPVTRIRKYEYISTNQITCNNSADKMVNQGGQCFTKTLDISFDAFVAGSDNCTGSKSGQAPNDSVEIIVGATSAAPCGKTINFTNIGGIGGPYDLSSFSWDPLIKDAVVDFENPQPNDAVFKFDY